MKKYNVDQKGISSDIKLVSFKSIKIESTDPMFSLKYGADYIQKMLDDEETNLHEFIVTAKVSYMSLLCINKNIHTRLLLRRKEFKEVLGYGYTSFTYRCRETTVKVKLVIFSVVSRNGDGSINITVESKLPNDKGEPIISKFPFFRLLKGESTGPTGRTRKQNPLEGDYFIVRLRKSTRRGLPKEYFPTGTMGDSIINGIVPSYLQGTWGTVDKNGKPREKEGEKERGREGEGEGECAICMEETANICFDKCQHIVCCESCIEKLKEKICPICRTPFINICFPVDNFFHSS